MLSAAAVGLAGLLLAALHPYRVWPNLLRIGWAIASRPGLPPRLRLRLARMWLADGLRCLVLTVPTLADRVFFRRWAAQDVQAPALIVGQPRSGTTFFHRTLSESGAFTSIPHFHWRYPFISVWWLVERRCPITALFDQLSSYDHLMPAEATDGRAPARRGQEGPVLLPDHRSLADQGERVGQHLPRARPDGARGTRRLPAA